MNTVFSDCRQYRYRLGRNLRDFPNDWSLPWVMLNPSTATARKDDATIRRIKWFSSRWGFGNITVVNLYAWKATKPKAVLSAILYSVIADNTAIG